MSDLSIEELKTNWEIYWRMKLPERLGVKMMQRSLAHKMNEAESGGLPEETQTHLDHLVRNFKQNPQSFDQRKTALKPGTKLLRRYNGIDHTVIVKEKGFEYDGKDWSSLSKIANHITGSRWNGWVFFGLKNK